MLIHPRRTILHGVVGLLALAGARAVAAQQPSPPANATGAAAQKADSGSGVETGQVSMPDTGAYNPALPDSSSYAPPRSDSGAYAPPRSDRGIYAPPDSATYAPPHDPRYAPPDST